MSRATDKRLSFKPYRQTVERVQIHFDLIRFSLEALKEKDQKRFFEKVSDEKIARIEKFRVGAKQMQNFREEDIDQIADDHCLNLLFLCFSLDFLD